MIKFPKEYVRSLLEESEYLVDRIHDLATPAYLINRGGGGMFVIYRPIAIKKYKVRTIDLDALDVDFIKYNPENNTFNIPVANNGEYNINWIPVELLKLAKPDLSKAKTINPVITFSDKYTRDFLYKCYGVLEIEYLWEFESIINNDKPLEERGDFEVEFMGCGPHKLIPMYEDCDSTYYTGTGALQMPVIYVSDYSRETERYLPVIKLTPDLGKAIRD